MSKLFSPHARRRGKVEDNLGNRLEDLGALIGCKINCKRRDNIVVKIADSSLRAVAYPGVPLPAPSSPKVERWPRVASVAAVAAVAVLGWQDCHFECSSPWYIFCGLFIWVTPRPGIVQFYAHNTFSSRLEQANRH